jgi:type IV secretion system protein VirB1
MVFAQQCAPLVAPVTLAAIVKTESGFKPLAININGGTRLSRQPITTAEAVSTARWLIKSGYNIDMGLGQVNSANLTKVGLSVEDAFDPCKNLRAAATILQGNYLVATRTHGNGQAALHAALSAYNTGSYSKGFANGYVQKVVGNVETFGANRAIRTAATHAVNDGQPNSIALLATPPKRQQKTLNPAPDTTLVANVFQRSDDDTMVFQRN